VRPSSNRFPFTPRLVILLILATAVVPAQQPQAPPAQPQQEQPPRFRTEANFVRVDVYPTKNGEAVQDLGRDDFEVLENGTRQQVQAFEHIVVSPAGPQSLRIEPNSVRAGEQMAANPRSRVFVFFLDVPHVPVEGSHAIKEPLIRLIDRILGPDDLVAVMTPEMSAAQISFGRKTAVIADMLRDNWIWGKRHSIIPMDAREREYERCYPPSSEDIQRGIAVNPVVPKLIARRRERMVLDSLRDLVTYLGGVREERKAIVTVSTGWLLYKPDSSVTILRKDSVTGEYEPVPGKAPVGVDEWGKLRVNPPRREPGAVNPDQTVCDRERMYLASIDNDDYFRYLLDVANRNNASFYPVDPRGLAAFDYPIGPEAPPPITIDSAHLRQRIETLRVLAENTDGIAVVNHNDLDRGLRRIADDLTSYYLLGYYSSNTKLDGQFRRITVRVKRPGVEVRARRGYRAATAEEVSAARTAAAAPVPDSVKTANSALAALERIRPEQRFSLHAVPIRDAATGAVSALWVAGELHATAQDTASMAAGAAGTAGATASIELSGGATGTASATINKGERAFLVKVPVQPGQGTIDVRARLTPAGGGAEIPLADATKIEMQPGSLQPLLFRRGLSTGNRLQPVAGFQFSRTDRLHLELPIGADGAPGSGRLLDRNAQPLQIPVQIGEKKTDDGQRWLTADATLSALGAGDYLVEVVYAAGAAEQRVLTAVRVSR
jgi:VWFA-related protein